MEKQLTVIMADPAGNRTAFVKDPVSRDLYAEIGNRLLQDESLRAEQAGFILDQPSDADGAMCMSGGEFCGNATRSFGYLLGKERGLKSGDTVRVRVSGSGDILDVTLEENGARVRMPCPGDVLSEVFQIPLQDGGSEEERRLSYVEMEGITHILIESSSVVKDAAYAVVAHMEANTKTDAAGAMFLHAVRDVPEGHVQAMIRQPGGTLTVLLEKKDGHVTSAFLGGPIILETPVKISI